MVQDNNYGSGMNNSTFNINIVEEVKNKINIEIEELLIGINQATKESYEMSRILMDSETSLNNKWEEIGDNLKNIYNELVDRTSELTTQLNYYIEQTKDNTINLGQKINKINSSLEEIKEKLSYKNMI